MKHLILFFFICAFSFLQSCRRPKADTTVRTDDTTNAPSIPDQTFGEIEKEIERDPGNPEGWYKRGLLNYDNGDLTSAISDFTKALELDPQLASAYHDRGICKHELEDYDGALSDYSEAIRIDPGFAEAYYNRAMLYDIRNDREKALADYNRTIELQPTFAPAYYNRGVYYFNFDRSKACEDFKKASDLGDKDAEKAYLQHCQK